MFIQFVLNELTEGAVTTENGRSFSCTSVLAHNWALLYSRTGTVWHMTQTVHCDWSASCYCEETLTNLHTIFHAISCASLLHEFLVQLSWSSVAGIIISHRADEDANWWNLTVTGFIGSLRSPWNSLNFKKKIPGPWKSLKSPWIWMFHILKFWHIKFLKKAFLYNLAFHHYLVIVH